MFRVYFILIALFISTGALCQNSEVLSKVKIDLKGKTILDLAQLGIEIDHGQIEPGRSITNVYSKSELNLIQQAGFDYKMVIPNVDAYFQAFGSTDQNAQTAMYRSQNCEDNGVLYNYDTPENYVYGSMAGYLTYEEALAELTKMSELYPDLVTELNVIGDVVTHEGRNIHYLRISSDVQNLDENKPQLLYTSVHHAREPNSLSQVIFYMWYLLENYDNDDEIKYLVDNTTMFFLPIVNPDGYVYNEKTNPNGGGFWRKNRYVNMDDDTVGVDLNRNYGYFWGFDNNGSSPNEGSQTYRGTGPFSEPETEAVRQLCNANQFQITLNYHTYGNLLIHPWGFSDMPTDEHDLFQSLGKIMNDENDFLFGTGSETVGYVVNGDSDDWFYGEEIEKDKIYAYTPEVGPAFWPGQENIDFLNKSAMRLNLNAAHLLHNFGWIRETFEINTIEDLSGKLYFEFEKSGLKPGDLTYGVVSKTAGVSLSGMPNIASMMDIGDKVDFDLDYTIDPTFNEESIEFEMYINNGLVEVKIPLIKNFVKQTTDVFPAYEDDLSSEDTWDLTQGEWGLTEIDFVSAPSSMTDSPLQNYGNNSVSEILFVEPIDLSNATEAYFNFMTKYAIESDWDYVTFEASSDGINFTPLCGTLTETAVANQNQNGIPVYDGFVNEWTPEEICLNDYIGEATVFIKFKLVTDQAVTEDGFYFDDVLLETDVETSSSEDLGFTNIVVVAPNPSRDYINLFTDRSDVTKGLKFEIRNSTGQLIERGQLDQPKLSIDISSYATGSYYVSFLTEEGKKSSSTFVKN